MVFFLGYIVPSRFVQAHAKANSACWKKDIQNIRLGCKDLGALAFVNGK